MADGEIRNPGADTGQFPIIMPPGSLPLDERLNRIENKIDELSSRIRGVELKVVYMSAIISTIVSIGVAILGFIIRGG